MSSINVQLDADTPTWAKTFVMSVKSGFESLSAEIKSVNTVCHGLSAKFSEFEEKIMDRRGA